MTVVKAIVALKEFFLGLFIYQAGKTSQEKDQLEDTLEALKEKVEKHEQISEDLARMSDAAVIDELRKNHSRKD